MALVEGPTWARPGQSEPRVLNPLRVEGAVSNVVDRFVPGVISTTTQARYLSLHGLVRKQAHEQSMELAESYDLVRRCEAVVAAIARHHDHVSVIPEAHGLSRMAHFVEPDGSIDVAKASARGAYSDNLGGFYATYRAPEQLLGVVSDDATQSAGDRYNDDAVRPAFVGLLDMVAQNRVSEKQLKAAGHLCPCAAKGDEAAWMRSIICGTAGNGSVNAHDEARRDTARMIARVIDDEGRVEWLQWKLRKAVAFGPPLDSGLLTGIDLAEGWRGLFLRNYSVAAWRNLWSSIVNECVEPQTVGQLIDTVTSALPSEWNVSDLQQRLPNTSDGRVLHPTEQDLRDENPGVDVLTEFRILAAGATRVSELNGRALKVLVGNEADDLGPMWVRSELERNGPRPLHLWVGELVEQLLWRAQSIALQKLDMTNPAKPRLPAQLTERDGRWFKTAAAGYGAVGTRLPSFVSMLVGSGVLGADEQHWWLRPEGREFLV